MFDKENTLICHVSDFHPPDIEIQLLKNGVEIQGAEQTDLAFEKGWKFHLTRSVKFSPSSGENYSCKVRHLRNTKTITWGKTDLEYMLNQPSHIFCDYWYAWDIWWRHHFVFFPCRGRHVNLLSFVSKNSCNTKRKCCS